ncbi:L,D-transpeptidase [Paenibacillus tarimensis]|uniref:L,D-transpeptidase n=1 Tax=Paenibacillus tarimensis TaxID=416012 RepID=UPI001F1A1B7E|nr:L,D-transpeptidase [Paenibacillus tarimensis]MCF2944994.1 L,D-transpeptidase [Paenibacillus tarimensis]
MFSRQKWIAAAVLAIAAIIYVNPISAAVPADSTTPANRSVKESGKPYRIADSEDEVYLLIDKSSHYLQVILNSKSVLTFPVATGRGALTPSGVFTIANKIVNPWYLPGNIPGGDKRNPFGTRWMGLSIPYTGGYKYGIHGTNRPYSIGSSVSSGCIRMRNTDVEWLYRHIPIGTKVVIRD